VRDGRKRLGFRGLPAFRAGPFAAWPGTTFSIPTIPTNEDWTGNGLHLLLAVLSAGVVLAVGHRRPSPALLPYLAAVACGATLFALAARWQPWHSRVHLPLFVLAAPMIALAFCLVVRQPLLRAVVAVILVWAALTPHLPNGRHALVGPASIFATSRAEQYFVVNRGLLPPYLNAADYVLASGCADIGVVAGPDDWEYPLWTLLSRHPELRIRHVGVRNASHRLVDAEGQGMPCMVVALRMGSGVTEWARLNGYASVSSMPPLLDFRHSPTASPNRATLVPHLKGASSWRLTPCQDVSLAATNVILCHGPARPRDARPFPEVGVGRGHRESPGAADDPTRNGAYRRG
jgi:hypothetical protein